MNILWFSSLAWQKQKKYLHDLDGPGAVSGSIFQQSIIEGLEQNGMEIDIINDYPIRGAKYFRSYEWSHNDFSKNIAIRKINVKPFLFISKTYNLLRSIEKKSSNKNYDMAITYLIHTPYLIGLKFAKIVNPNIKTLLICPDLPDYMDMSLNRKPIKRFAKKLDGLLINNLLKDIDAFVLFSELMQNKLPINDKPKIVIEGVFTGDSLNLKKVNREKAILHAGTLHKNIGVENIIDAFMSIEDEELQLWIFGDGDLKEYVKEKAIIDERIVYKGFVSREELFEYEKKASLLINARNPDDEFTFYSFPSKTFEYMVSGTPFLTTKLEGIPEEYYDYLYMMDSNEVSVIADNIRRIFSFSRVEKEEFGLKAREFVLERKNKDIQSNKLLEFISELKESIS